MLTYKRKMQKDIFKMIFPIMISSILEMMVGFVSMALIGNLGAIAIGAMGLSTRVRGLLWSVYKGIAIGGQVVTAQSVGAKDKERIRKTIEQTIGSITIISIFFLLLIQFFPALWLGIFNAKDHLLDTAIDVLRIVSLGFPFLGIVIVSSGCFQGTGDAFTPMLVNIFMNVSNAVIGIILVKGLFGFPEMGLMGAAYAMFLAQAAAAVLAILLLVRKKGLLTAIKIHHFFSFSQPIISAIYKTGIPSVLESLFWNVSSIFIIRSILTYGNDAYASYQLGLQAESLAYMPAAGFQIAATAYVGRFLGGQEPDKAKDYFREVLKWAVLLSMIGGGILVFLPKQVLGIMTNDAALIHNAVIYMIFCGLAQVPQNVAGVLGGALRGAGYTKLPMYAAGIGIYGVRIPLALLSAFVFHWPIYIIFLAIALDMIARLILNSTLYFKAKIYEKPNIV
jgi:putative MATE family efflux protein